VGNFVNISPFLRVREAEIYIRSSISSTLSRSTLVYKYRKTIIIVIVVQEKFKMENLEARLTTIEDEWEVRFDTLNAEYVALKTTMESELEARMTEVNAEGCEIEALGAEYENLFTTDPESSDASDVLKWITGVRTKQIALSARIAQLKIQQDDAEAEWDVLWAARKAEQQTLRDEVHDQKEAYEAAINTELEVWYSAWQSAYNEELRTTPATGSVGMAEICSICTEDFVHREDTGFQLSCNHQFHQLCLKPWIKDSYTCPLCRQIPSSG